MVDDHAAQRYVFVEVLRRAGFHTREATSGTEALERVREEPPDLVLLDVQLPDVLGYEVSRRLKADPATATVPILQLSAAFTRPEDRVEGLQGGADAFLVAPVDPGELVATVQTLLRMSELLRERARLLAAEQRARQEAEGLNAQLAIQARLLEQVQDSIIVTDLSGRITHWNHGAEALFGHRAEDVVGRSLTVIYPGRNEEQLRAGLEGVLQKGDQRVEWEGTHAAGYRVWADVRTSVLRDAAGAPVGFVGLSKDITRKRRDQDELRRRVEFEEQLVGIVSHDLRNPLQAVSMSAALLLRQPGLEERQRRLAQRVEHSARRAQRLIRDLLDFSQARVGGGIPISRQAHDMHVVVRETVEEMRAGWEGRPVEVSCEGDGWGLWDADRVSQVVGNLVGNALQHGAPGTPVRVSSRAEGNSVQLAVHNLGEPIPTSLLPHLFEPFRSGEGSAHTSRGSVGLGLFISQHIVQGHGGNIHVHSSAQEGTVFQVSWPRA